MKSSGDEFGKESPRKCDHWSVEIYFGQPVMRATVFDLMSVLLDSVLFAEVIIQSRTSIVLERSRKSCNRERVIVMFQLEAAKKNCL